jgi:EAL and modified HD-GYP domain-containing signal transduction protein
MSDILVARQPIFDLVDRVAGYELLYRDSASAQTARGTSQVHMSAETVVNAFVGIGLENITGGRPAFVNFSRELLIDGTYELLNKDNVVIELLESVRADDNTLAAVKRLKAKGYKLALDDYTFDAGHEPFLEFADIVKIDVLNRTETEMREFLTRLEGTTRARVLAERVETQSAHMMAKSIGYELFQGYYYSRPEIVAKKKMPMEQVNTMRLLNILRDSASPETKVEDAFRSDPTLSFKLLHIVNSAAVGGRGITSIGFAIRLLGREALYRWLSLILVSSMVGNKELDTELVGTALARARLGEVLAEKGGKAAVAGTLFMVGLFSMLDALTRMPMGEILKQVDLAPEAKEALLKKSGPYSPALQLIEGYERGDWNAVTAQANVFNVPVMSVPDLYLDALSWSREKLRALGR